MDGVTGVCSGVDAGMTSGWAGVVLVARVCFVLERLCVRSR